VKTVKNNLTKQNCKYCPDFSYVTDMTDMDHVDKWLLSYANHLKEAHPQEWANEIESMEWSNKYLEVLTNG
jgi:hypothetical protein